MRFLTTTNGRKSINIDSIKTVSIDKISNFNDSDSVRFILVINGQGFYAGDFTDVKLRYCNLMDILSNMDVPSGSFVPNNCMVVMKDDGIFECVESSLWSPEVKEEYFYSN